MYLHGNINSFRLPYSVIQICLEPVCPHDVPVADFPCGNCFQKDKSNRAALHGNLCIYKKHARGPECFFNKSSFATSEIMDGVLP